MNPRRSGPGGASPDVRALDVRALDVRALDVRALDVRAPAGWARWRTVSSQGRGRAPAPRSAFRGSVGTDAHRTRSPEHHPLEDS
ncbi:MULTISPECIES: hypothetical protein [Streptomyces]|uniref:hypothetical protein n=1 Tax=Streptomyces TaxID=1883 RepID=UPI00081B517F|nr:MULTISPECIES: hypothetical protein [unclassified Streptomyces]MYQ50161.1 hypothetical protein [Streptomyces sp. SID4941]SCD34956.1 hypothetical protein GA0115247_103224 [Streptomyces sp. PalvLS-984]SDD28497.1 hypothetical protein F558DRAFT_03761 [Streptomyces sp. AmelKG-A3]